MNLLFYVIILHMLCLQMTLLWFSIQLIEICIVCNVCLPLWIRKCLHLHVDLKFQGTKLNPHLILKFTMEITLDNDLCVMIIVIMKLFIITQQSSFGFSLGLCERQIFLLRLDHSQEIAA